MLCSHENILDMYFDNLRIITFVLTRRVIFWCSFHGIIMVALNCLHKNEMGLVSCNKKHKVHKRDPCSFVAEQDDVLHPP